jgi:HK97 family phage major capsid protein
MHTDILRSIMLLKDNDGQYMWRPGLRDGEPDTILGMPVIESEFAPNTVGTNLYVIVLGDFKKYYKFAYWKSVEIQLLVEKFAGKNQIGYLGHTLADGMPTLAEAFTRLKVGNKTSTGTVAAT